MSSLPEYIVAFNGYYKSQARKNFIAAALNNSIVKNWNVIERNNPAKDYPSDFDVVTVS